MNKQENYQGRLVKIVAHRKHIFCWPQEIIPHKETSGRLGTAVPAKDNRIIYPKQGQLGLIIIDTARDLAISEEALAILKKIAGRSTDAISDFDWWNCTNGKSALSWFGPIYRVINPATTDLARDWNLSRQLEQKRFTIIPNETNREFNQYFKDENFKEWSMWKTPHSLGTDKPWEAKQPQN